MISQLILLKWEEKEYNQISSSLSSGKYFFKVTVPI